MPHKSDPSTIEPSARVLERVREYQPNFDHRKLPQTVWEAVRDEVDARVLAVARNENDAYALLCAAAALVAWAHRINLPITGDVLFRESTCTRHLGSVSDSSRATLKTLLTRLLTLELPEGAPVSTSATRAVRAGDASPGDGWAVSQLNGLGIAPCVPYWQCVDAISAHIRGNEMDRNAALTTLPYTSHDIVGFFTAAATLRVHSTRQAVRAWLCAGLGAGVVGADALNATARDVTTNPGGLVTVTVGHSRNRTVPVLEPFAGLLADIAGETGDGSLVSRRAGATANSNRWNMLATSVAGKATGLPRLDGRRLRATWLCVHLSLGTGLRELLDTAGITHAERLDAFLPMCPNLYARKSDLAAPWRQT